MASMRSTMRKSAGYQEIVDFKSTKGETRPLLSLYDIDRSLAIYDGNCQAEIEISRSDPSFDSRMLTVFVFGHGCWL